jgi:hypothetical protein
MNKRDALWVVVKSAGVYMLVGAAWSAVAAISQSLVLVLMAATRRGHPIPDTIVDRYTQTWPLNRLRLSSSSSLVCTYCEAGTGY